MCQENEHNFKNEDDLKIVNDQTALAYTAVAVIFLKMKCFINQKLFCKKCLEYPIARIPCRPFWCLHRFQAVSECSRGWYCTDQSEASKLFIDQSLAGWCSDRLVSQRRGQNLSVNEQNQGGGDKKGLHHGGNHGGEEEQHPLVPGGGHSLRSPDKILV